MSTTAAQAISRLQAYAILWRLVQDHLEGELTIQAAAIDDELVLGDSSDITSFQQQALRQFRQSANNYYESALAFLSSIHPTLGEVASSPDPLGDADTNLAFLNDYLIANSKAVLKRGFTKSSWSAGGSNVGNGRILQLKTDFNGDDADCAHPDPSLRLRCMASAGRGVREGEEPFELIGSATRYPWQDTGISNNGVYTPQLGRGLKEFDGGDALLRVTNFGPNARSILSMSGGSSLNLLTNGAMETAVSGADDDRFSGLYIISGGSNLSIESTAPIVGDQSLKIDGNCVFGMLLKSNGVFPKTPIAFGALVKKVISSSTLTGTLTIVLRSGGTYTSAASGTAHKTITVTIGSLSSNTVTAEDETFVWPASVGDDARIEFTVTSYTDGSGTANSLLIDEMYAARMYQLDMGQCILPVRGSTAWELDDLFTASVTDLAGGELQEFLNRTFGRYVKPASSATTWVDPTFEPEISVTYNGSNVADGGDILLGTVATGAHSVTIVWANTGPAPLAIALPTTSAATNASLTDDGMTTPIVIKPGRTYSMTVEVTDGGAGAFTITLTFPNNDSSESTFDIVISGTAI